MRIYSLAAILFFSSAVWAADRPTVVYGQVGLSKNMQSLKGDANTSSYNGWGAGLEAGFDWSWNERYGLNGALEATQIDLINKGNSTAQAETGDFSTLGGKLGLYIGAFTIGGGYRKLNLKTTAITNNSSQETSVSGSETFAYVNLTFNIAKKYRSTVELSAGSGSADTLKTQSAALTLRIGIIEPL